MFKYKLVNSYLYGSNVYGTANKNSDIDYIYIFDAPERLEEQMLSGGTNINYYSIPFFQDLIHAHDVSALECLFLPKEFKIELYKFDFNLDLDKLRCSFSSKSSNSWVKAKKKIEVHKEYYLGQKSLFHSLRILDFGIQIATKGKIDFTNANYYWAKIQEQNFTNWNDYKNYYQDIYNKLKTEFRLVAPKKVNMLWGDLDPGDIIRFTKEAKEIEPWKDFMGEFKEGDLKVLSIRKGIHGFIIRTKFKNGEKSFHIYEDGTWKDKDGYAQLFEIVKLGDN